MTSPLKPAGASARPSQGRKSALQPGTCIGLIKPRGRRLWTNLEISATRTYPRATFFSMRGRQSDLISVRRYNIMQYRKIRDIVPRENFRSNRKSWRSFPAKSANHFKTFSSQAKLALAQRQNRLPLSSSIWTLSDRLILVL
jgi:hypothetical protein